VIGIVHFGAELRGEVFVLERVPIIFAMKLLRRRLSGYQRVPVPLGITGFVLFIDGGKGRYRIDAPMDKNAEFRVGKPTGYGGVADNIEKPAFATAIGLMLFDAERMAVTGSSKTKKSSHVVKEAQNFLTKFFTRFKV